MSGHSELTLTRAEPWGCAVLCPLAWPRAQWTCALRVSLVAGVLAAGTCQAVVGLHLSGCPLEVLYLASWPTWAPPSCPIPLCLLLKMGSGLLLGP